MRNSPASVVVTLRPRSVTSMIPDATGWPLTSTTRPATVSGGCRSVAIKRKSMAYITPPMTSWLGDWANLLLRWTHFIAGIAWIGSSFYFIWLDRALTKPEHEKPGVEGDLWMVHSGGFYQVEKRRPGPGEVPAVLHWFKWEAMLTWITGIALLILVFYLGSAYLLGPNVSGIGRGAALALGIGSIVLSWPIYDGLWRSPLARRPAIATVISLALLTAVTAVMCRLLSGRAAFMHIGALLGTIMVANVW